VQNAFLLSERIEYLLNELCSALYKNYLAAQIFVQMHVRRRKYIFVMLVLQMRQSMAQMRAQMVVNQRYRPESLAVFVPLFLYDFIANQIANKFGTISIVAFSDHFFEFMKKRFFNRKTYPD